jgi:hypothetical protein
MLTCSHAYVPKEFPMAQHIFARLSAFTLCAILIASCGVASAPGQSAETAVATIAQPTMTVAATLMPEQPTTEPPLPATEIPLEATLVPTPDEQQQAPIAPCTFPLPQNAAAGPESVVPPLEAYQFSKPQLYPNPTNEYVQIAEWLPNNRQLLITRAKRDRFEVALEVLDTQTESSTSYGIVAEALSRPFWIESQQAIAFLEPQYNQRTVAINASVVVRTADGQTTSLVTDLISPFVAPTMDRQSLTILSKQQPQQPQAVETLGGAQQKQLPSLKDTGLSQSLLPSSTDFQLDPWYTPRFAWSPDGNQMVSYSQYGTFLIHAATQKTCALILDTKEPQSRWAMDTQWSPDGRYIAFQSSIYRDRGNIDTIELTILDSMTGMLTNLGTGFKFNYGFLWLPGGRQMLVLGQSGISSAGVAMPKLYIADIRDGRTIPILPEQLLGTVDYNGGGGSAALSDDGKLLALVCVQDEFATSATLCIVNITTQP